MALKEASLPYADVTGTPDLPSPEAGLDRAQLCASAQQWGERVGRAIARNPGYLLAGAALAGFLAGHTVKRLLSANRGRS
jgi:hypothetical protein